MYRAEQPPAGYSLRETVTRTYGLERPETDLKLFKHRVIVAGSRDFEDYPLFETGMFNYLERHFAGQYERVCFITGFAKTGADALIVRFCEQHGFAWVRFEAKWDDLDAPGAVIRRRRDGTEYNVRAGYDRNKVMASRGTNLIAWWDGVSGGTRDMIAQAEKRNLTTETVLIDTPPKEVPHGRQSQSGASRHSGIRGEAASGQ